MSAEVDQSVHESDTIIEASFVVSWKTARAKHPYSNDELDK